ncbi:MAG: hypothetical protein AAF360_08215 [Pseudomonadota bacterium]
MLRITLIVFAAGGRSSGLVRRAHIDQPGRCVAALSPKFATRLRHHIDRFIAREVRRIGVKIDRGVEIGEGDVMAKLR